MVMCDGSVGEFAEDCPSEVEWCLTKTLTEESDAMNEIEPSGIHT